MIPSQAWSAKREEILRGCITRKLSARQAGDELGITRNAAIGKASRMGLKFLSVGGLSKRRTKPSPNYDPSRPKVDIKPRFPYRKAPPVVPESIAPLMLTFDQLHDSRAMTQCRAPYGDDPKAMVYCGHPTVYEGAWCSYHFREFCPGKYAVKS